MRAGLADEFAAKPPGRGTPGQLASPALRLIYDERAGSLLGLYAARDQRTRASALGPGCSQPLTFARQGLSERSRGQSFAHEPTVAAHVQTGAPCSSLSRSTPLSIVAERLQPLKLPRSRAGLR